MLDIFHGLDSFTRTESFRRSCKDVCDKHGIARIQTANISTDEGFCSIKEAVSFSGLFGDRPSCLVISGIGDVTGKKSVYRDLLDACARSKTVYAHLNESWRKGIPAALKAVFKDVAFCEHSFPALDERRAVDALHETMKKQNIAVDKDAVAFLYRGAGGDMWQVARTLEKYALLVPHITRVWLEKHGDGQLPAELFSIVKPWISHASLGTRMAAWQKLAGQRPNYYGVLGYLAKAAHTPGLVQQLAQADIKIKSGFLEPDQALLEIVLS
jgi:DNA polymerase III delta subunit